MALGKGRAGALDLEWFDFVGVRLCEVDILVESAGQSDSRF